MAVSPLQTRAAELIIDGESYRVRPRVTGHTEVGSADERQTILDVPGIVTWFPRGMGASVEGRPGMYDDGELIDTFSSPGYTLPAGKVYEYTFNDGFAGSDFGLSGTYMYGNDLRLVYGRAIYAVANGSATTMSLHADLGVNMSGQSAVTWKDAAYVGRVNTSTGAWGELFKDDGTTQSSLTGINRRTLSTGKWRPDGVPRDVLLGTTSAFDIRWCYDDPGVDGNWFPSSPGTRITDGYHHIRSIAADSEHFWFGCQSGLHDLEASGYAPNRTPKWRARYDIDNGMATVVHGGYVYSSFIDGLVRMPISGGTDEQCGIGTGLQYNGKGLGRYTALATWGQYVIAAVYNWNSRDSGIYFGIDKNIIGADVPGPMVWHGSYSPRIPGYITHIAVVTPQGAAETVRTSFLYYGSVDPGVAYHMYQQSIPKNGSAYGELISGGQHTFAVTGATLRLADLYPEYPTARRDLWMIDSEQQRMTGVNSVSISTNSDGADEDLDGDLDWVERMTTDRNGRASQIVSTSLGSVARVRLMVELDGTEQQPPVWLGLRLRTDINHALQDVRSYDVLLRDGQNTGADTHEVRSILSRDRALKRLVGLHSTRVIVRDEFGVTWRAQIVGIGEVSAKQSENNWPTMPTVTIRYLYRTIQYDAGDHYDEGNPYGDDSG